MKALFLLFLAALVAAVFGWDKEDHEIFDLVSAVEASEGKGTTFYSWLDVSSTATTPEIAKAYRKMSMQLHPDKNPNDKLIHERFARLGVVSTILRNVESRKRYDFFYKNGVPKWRGTGYYYSRFRPGLGSVLVFLAILTSALQYLVQTLNYKRDLGRIIKIQNDARLAAWGAKMVPVEGQRKVKVNLGGPSSRDEEGNVIRGRTLDMVVEGQNTYIIDGSGGMEPLDASSAVPPHIKRTWVLALGSCLYAGVFKSPQSPATDLSEEDEDGSSSDISGTSTPNGTKYAPVNKAGGKKRKVPKKR